MTVDSWMAICLLAIRRRMAIVALLAAVGTVTAVALIGMLPSVGWVTPREGLLLASVNLLAMSAYFRWLSPQREAVSPIVTSGLAVLSAAFALISSRVVITTGWVAHLELLGVSCLLLLSIIIWAWYDLLVLHSFSERVDDLSDGLPLFEDES